MIADVAYDIGLLVGVFGVFVLVAGRLASRVVRASQGARTADDRGQMIDAAVGEIRSRLERGEAPPLSEDSEARSGCSSQATHTRPRSLNSVRAAYSSTPDAGSDSSSLFPRTWDCRPCSCRGSFRRMCVSVGRRPALKPNRGSIPVRHSSSSSP